MRSNFCFLEENYLELYQNTVLAEKLYEVDAGSRIAKSRLFCEKLTVLIAYVQTLVLDTVMVIPEEVVKKAISKIKTSKDFNKVQLKWIERFDQQLIAEKVLQRQDLDLQPFLSDGGFKRLDKIFNSELDKIFNSELDDLMKELNQELYTT